MDLQRLIITFKSDETIMHALYRTQDGPNGAKTRRREVTNLAREGLHQALAALEERVDVVGTSGFSQREDILLAAASPSEANLVKKGA